MRLIHVVENLDRGAVENWLVNIFLESREYRPGWDWTFYCIVGEPGKLDERVREAGGHIIYAPVTVSDKFTFLRHLRRTLQAGAYDILHVHHDYLSGFYLLASIGISFRKRVLHIHNNDRVLPVANPLVRRLLLPVFRRFTFLLSDHVLCISKFTLEDYRLGFRGKKPLFSVLYYGIDMTRFEDPVDPVAFRVAHGIPERGKVILFTGRMNREKNPEYVVDVLHRLLAIRDDVYAIFVGKGDKEAAVIEKARNYGIEGRIRMIGWSDNIPGFMKNSDVFVFPRLLEPREGLGIVVLESQCAGLPMFITGGIEKDPVVVQELAHGNELGEPDVWAKGIDRLLHDSNQPDKAVCLERMKDSAFELSHATKNLLAFYEA
jgi:glycosyltransferase involved in cell wall biosynthesis